MEELRQYPLLFEYYETVIGRGFIAGVVARGRALIVNEGDGWWTYGVTPGGLTGSAPSPGGASEAHDDFRRTFRAVLHDIANAADDFDDFKARVYTFFYETNQETLGQWRSAREQVRLGGQANAAFNALPRVTDECPATAEVRRIDTSALVPSANSIEPVPSVAA